MTSFDALGVAPALVKTLARDGIVAPFPIQALTIPDALAGRDVLGKARTGSGKTLAFGVPLLERIDAGRPGRPTGLILVPTRELARQVFTVLVPLAKAAGRRVVSIYGGTEFDRDLKALRHGVDVVVATPGRLIDLVQRNAAALDGIQVAVVDEADRMNDMGFRPQVEWLLRRCPGRRQTLLFSATLDHDVESLVRGFLRDPVRHEATTEPTIELMEHRFIAVHQMDKAKVTAAIAAHQGRTLVFVRTKRGADRLMRQLDAEGVSVDAIHGDRTQGQREHALKRFTDGRLSVLVATDVAARGIHVDAIDVVVHYDPPEDAKAYTHRSGRTARAGEAGLVVTLVLWDQILDVQRLQRQIGVGLPIVEMFSNDPRLADLAAWDPATVAA
ncbi:MAG: DEAD/DEAH box helicase [Acidimicrobiales bacterium]